MTNPLSLFQLGNGGPERATLTSVSSQQEGMQPRRPNQGKLTLCNTGDGAQHTQDRCWDRDRGRAARQRNDCTVKTGFKCQLTDKSLLPCKNALISKR